MIMRPLADATLLRNQALIAGAFVGDEQMPVADPATGSVLTCVPDVGEKGARAAVEAAAQAFPEWAALPAKQRSALLRRWFNLVFAHRDDLAVLLTSEQGKPFAEALVEVDYAASYIEFYAEEAKRLSGEILAAHRADSRIAVLRQPVGVVAAITPWNFPAAMVTRKLAPALAAGCTAVLKPAPETPLTALALAELAMRAGLPAGVLNVVTGEAQAIGDVFTTHPAIRVVSFTGSTPVGKLLAQQSTGTLKKVLLELGGNAPFIVFEDADLDLAVEGAMISKYRNMGQTCVCTNRFYVHASVHDTFVDKLAARVGSLKVGNGFEDSIEQGPLIGERAVAKVERHLEDAVAKGARIAVGGHRHGLGGTFFEPTIVTGVTAAMAINREETFGPIAAITLFESEDDVVRAANDTEAGLAAYFYARDMNRIIRVTERLAYGMVGVNTGLISTELAPFGGIKESGNSREGSHYGIHEFTELKYVCIGGVS